MQHLSKARTDSPLIIPQIQRNLNKNIVNDILQYIINQFSKNEELIFMPLAVCEIYGVYGKTLYLIDGQHRFSAMQEYYKRYNKIIEFDIKIFPVKNLEEVKQIFILLNKSVQVSEIYLEQNSNIDLYKEIEKLLSGIGGFNDKKRRPDINLTQFINKLKDSSLMKTIHSINDFGNRMNEENIRLQNLLQNPSFIKRNDITDNMIKKWNEWGNFLGADKNFVWLD